LFWHVAGNFLIFLFHWSCVEKAAEQVPRRRVGK
jgi:hypothetical protein